MKTFYNLQICRGIAAIIVVFAHAAFLIDSEVWGGITKIGWCGVDFFFVLSGFIIYYVSERSLGNPAQLGSYFKKRLLRIYPIYWVYTLMFLAINLVVYKLTQTKLISWIPIDGYSIIRSFTLYPTDVKNGEMPFIPVAHTLTYEVIFYCIFALGILLPRNRFQYLCLGWLGGILLSTFGLLDVGSSLILECVFSPKNIEFFYGGAIAYWTLKRTSEPTLASGYRMMLLGVATLAVSWVCAWKGIGIFQQYSFIYFAIPFSLIICAATILEPNEAHGRARRILIMIGDASYSLYLIHFTLMVLVNGVLKKLHFPTMLRFCSTCVILVLISLFFYKFAERPLTKRLQSKFK